MLKKRHLGPLKKERKKYKRLVIDVSEEEHKHIKMEAVKRNISIRELATKSLIYFLERYSR